MNLNNKNRLNKKFFFKFLKYFYKLFKFNI